MARRAVLCGLIAGEVTIYPLLARLRRNGLVETSRQESEEGPQAIGIIVFLVLPFAPIVTAVRLEAVRRR